ncbi:MAG: cyanophycinase [Candidatus Acidiferrales bacterium]
MKSTPPTAPTFVALLLGGNGEVDDAVRSFCSHSGGGEIVVLRASGADGMNPYLHQLCPQNSVTTLLITSIAGAKNPVVTRHVRDAHAIYIAGGDQSNYVKMWSGNSLQKEIDQDVARRVPIGGLSAGLAVLGQYVFSSRLDTVTSPQALANPYDPRVTLERRFLTVPVLKGVITDSHFSQRERMGRSMAFLARIVQDGWAKKVHGIGIDETTAVLIGGDGKATVSGKGSAYFFTLDHRPELCAPGKPLTVRRITAYKLPGGDASKFDLKSWTGSGGSNFTVDVIDGKMTQTGQ